MRDAETGGHTDWVVRYAMALGQALGLSTADLAALELGAMLRDVGKIGISDRVLLKPGALDGGEWALIRVQAVEGERFTAALGFLPTGALALIRHHHERWYSSGYPDGLMGERMPVLARVFAVLDV